MMISVADRGPSCMVAEGLAPTSTPCMSELWHLAGRAVEYGSPVSAERSGIGVVRWPGRPMNSWTTAGVGDAAGDRVADGRRPAAGPRSKASVPEREAARRTAPSPTRSVATATMPPTTRAQPPSPVAVLRCAVATRHRSSRGIRVAGACLGVAREPRPRRWPPRPRCLGQLVRRRGPAGLAGEPPWRLAAVSALGGGVRPSRTSGGRCRGRSRRPRASTGSALARRRRPGLASSVGRGRRRSFWRLDRGGGSIADPAGRRHDAPAELVLGAVCRPRGCVRVEREPAADDHEPRWTGGSTSRSRPDAGGLRLRGRCRRPSRSSAPGRRRRRH